MFYLLSFVFLPMINKPDVAHKLSFSYHREYNRKGETREKLIGGTEKENVQFISRIASRYACAHFESSINITIKLRATRVYTFGFIEHFLLMDPAQGKA